MDGTSKCSPAAAVPVSTKIPDPMIAPMPSAVSDHGPSVFFSRCSGSCDSEISLSMDLQQKSWLGRRVLPHPTSSKGGTWWGPGSETVELLREFKQKATGEGKSGG